MRILMVSAVMAATFAVPAGAIAEPSTAGAPAAAIAQSSNELRLSLRDRGDLFRIAGQYARAIADYRTTLNLEPVDSFRKLVEKAIRELGGSV